MQPPCCLTCSCSDGRGVCDTCHCCTRTLLACKILWPAWIGFPVSAHKQLGDVQTQALPSVTKAVQTRHSLTFSMRLKHSLMHICRHWPRGTWQCRSLHGARIFSAHNSSLIWLCCAWPLSYPVVSTQGAAGKSTCMHSHRQLMLSSAYSWTAPQPSSRLHSSPDPETTQTHKYMPRFLAGAPSAAIDTCSHQRPPHCESSWHRTMEV